MCVIGNALVRFGIEEICCRLAPLSVVLPNAAETKCYALNHPNYEKAANEYDRDFFFKKRNF